MEQQLWQRKFSNTACRGQVCRECKLTETLVVSRALAVIWSYTFLPKTVTYKSSSNSQTFVERKWYFSNFEIRISKALNNILVHHTVINFSHNKDLQFPCTGVIHRIEKDQLKNLTKTNHLNPTNNRKRPKAKQKQSLDYILSQPKQVFQKLCGNQRKEESCHSKKTPAELKEHIETEAKQGKDFLIYSKVQYWFSNKKDYN